jgi:hypothetical protein
MANKKSRKNRIFKGFFQLLLVVGMTGFEPATPRPPAECSTGLSHIPNSSRTKIYRCLFQNSTLRSYLNFTNIRYGTDFN